MVKPAFLIRISLPFEISAILESKETKWVFSLPETFNLICVVSEITSGRALRLCGAMGVSTKDFAEGAITGPPQLKEYPVDPVGVETINPSDQYEVKYSSSNQVSTVIMEVVSFRLTVISFNAKFGGDLMLNTDSPKTNPQTALIPGSRV